MTAPNRPTMDGDSEPWWAAVQDRTLTVNACADCGRHTLYPRPFCPNCWSEEVRAVPACGRATLYTWSVVHQNAAPFDSRAPYVVAMVDLEEGPRMMTSVENCRPETLRAGMDLVIAYREEGDGFVVPVCQPAP